MLHGQMLTLQMSPRQLTTHADGLTIQPSKFGRVLTSNSGDMASYLMFNYRDPKKNPKKNPKMNFAKPVVDIAASIRSRAGAKLASLGGSLTENSKRLCSTTNGHTEPYRTTQDHTGRLNTIQQQYHTRPYKTSQIQIELIVTHPTSRLLCEIPLC